MKIIKLAWTDESWEDYLFWQKNDIKKLNKINDLIKEIKRDPFCGIGKPEKLKFNFSGYWSRRITIEHRLVYKISNDTLSIAQCRHHYEK